MSLRSAIDPSIPSTLYATAQRRASSKSTDNGGQLGAPSNSGPEDHHCHCARPSIPRLRTRSTAADIWQRRPSRAPTVGAAGAPVNNTDLSTATVHRARHRSQDSEHALRPRQMTGRRSSRAPTVGAAGAPSTNADLSQPPLSPALAIDPSTPSTLYARTFAGVFKSTDSGGSWSAAQHRPGQPCQCARH